MQVVFSKTDVAAATMVSWARELVRDRQWDHARRTLMCLGLLIGQAVVHPAIAALSKGDGYQALDIIERIARGR